MILIHPPVAKPSEPPAGVAKLSGALAGHGIKHAILDANLEALLYIITGTHLRADKQYDKWTARALRNISGNHASTRNWRIFQNIDRYKRTVIDLSHAVEQWAENGATPGIANYRHKYLSPLRSADLLLAAEHPEENPYYPYFSKRLPVLVERNTSPVVGFSLNYLSQALCTFAMAGFLKQHFPGLSIVLGGGLVTSWMKNPDWQNPFGGLIDHLVAGPGERKLLAILGVNDMKEEYSRPDYGLLPLDDYLAPGRILPYSASSGCYWNKCSFCPEKAEKNPYVPVPVDTAINDLNELTGETGPFLVHLLDNAISSPLLKRLAGNAGGLPWYGFARISRMLTDIDFCMGLKKSGCVMLKLGLESGDQGVLDKMQKGIDLGTASLALKTLKKAGIATYVYLIFGTPAETLPAAGKTLEFVARHKDEIGFLNVALFNMPICGPEASRFETSSFYEGDLSLYTDFSHPAGWNRKEVRLFLENEFKKNRAVSGILMKDPPIFTSNHAAFFVM
ncbi:MAG: radical SAM protein [Nitrospirota bacterium]|nr:radical SAM protein [Nitrospirota bacterium]